MAKAEHLKIIKQGVSVWNEWRNTQSDVVPELSNANLNGKNLSSINFESANLIDANLSYSNLIRASLQNADLGGADLSLAKVNRANLEGANLRFADLQGAFMSRTILKKCNLIDAKLSVADLFCANLEGADLAGAVLFRTSMAGTKLSGADLTGCMFYRSNFGGTNFNNCRLGETIFANCDFSNAHNLNKIKHISPSTIGIDTLINSKGNIPRSFLVACGITKEIEDLIHPITTKNSDKFFTCFISYSSKDIIFAKTLKNDLEKKNVICWFFPEHAKWGEDIYKNIEEAIKSYDKLIVICSENSLNSESVLREIERALQKEKTQREKHKETRRVLFPITIDDYMFSRWEHYLKPDILRITVGDFRNKEDIEKYDSALDKLGEALIKE